MKRALPIALLVGFTIWNLPPLEVFKDALIDLIVLGRIPGTEIYLSFLMTLVLALVLLQRLHRWFDQLAFDLVEFRLERAKKEAALQAQRSGKLPAATAQAQGLSTEELDLQSI